MLFKNKVLLAKAESSYGVDPTPASSDAVLTSNLQVQPYTGPTVSRDFDKSTLGGSTVINTNPQVQLTFDVEIAGSGTASVVPAYDVILRGCGFSQTTTSPTGLGIVYLPLSSSFPSVAFYFNHDGQRHKVLGARGNLQINLARGAIPKYSFTFIGQYTRPATATDTGVVTDYIAPVAVTDTNTPTFTLGGSPLQSLRAESLSIDMGNNVVPRNIINANEIYITDRNVTGTMVFEAPTLATKNWFTAAESHAGVTTMAMALIHGTTAGNIVGFTAPALQFTNIAQQDSDGIVVYSCGFVMTPVSGNDEIKITTL